LRDGPSGRKYKFAGTFRLPFLGSYRLPTGGPTLREMFCPLTPTPNTSLGGMDIVWVETAGGQPSGRCINSRPEELSLGSPVVRFEVSFSETFDGGSLPEKPWDLIRFKDDSSGRGSGSSGRNGQ
jgi:hypothetical protein